MKMGIKLAVVSDAPSREAWMRIYYLNLHNHFDIVLTFDDTNARKPSPIPFQMALKELKTEPSETLMVGDWPERDVPPARKVIGVFVSFAYLRIDITSDSFSGLDTAFGTRRYMLASCA